MATITNSCPFCESMNIMVELFCGESFVKCHECGAEGPKVNVESMTSNPGRFLLEAIEKWNIRKGGL